MASSTTTPTPNSESNGPESGADAQSIRDLLRLMQTSSHTGGAAQEANQERDLPEQPAALLDESSVPVQDVAPLHPSAFVDGIQTSLKLGYREHRPIYLNYVAAGAVRGDTRVITTHKRLDVVCAEADADWLRENGCNVPIIELSEEAPYKIAALASQELAGIRSGLERKVARVALDTTDGPVVIDGHLFGYERDSRLIGIVKSTNTRYLLDETILWSLPEGWRSPRFLLEGIRGAKEMSKKSRVSAYYRLMDATARGWDFGLIRVESWDANLIDMSCAMAREQRVAPGEYNRWDRHLRGVTNVEKILKAQRPTVFDLF